MPVIHDKKTLHKMLLAYRSKSDAIGLVPTMGALHEGHLSLVKKSLSDNAVTVVSIFVNPTQFNNKSDLKHYPKDLKTDVKLLYQLNNNIIVFAPSITEAYEGNMVTKSFDFEGLDKVMEGAFRTNHFNGVATIVALLFEIVAPQKAYFGEKDFQQLQIIKKLVQLRQIPVQIVSCPIAREAHGLARSSRNERLSPATREKAGFIYKSLLTAKNKFGTENASLIAKEIEAMYAEHPLFKLEYFEIAEADSLIPISIKSDSIAYRAFIAVYADKVRLIDNIALN
ncbi:MAG: pantoate--beta-alanine ligase [Bacteroidota bacterium]